MDKKTWPTHMLPTRDPTQKKDLHRLKVKVWKKIFQAALAGVAQWIEPGLRTKGLPFNFQSGHMPGLRVRSPVGGTQEAITQ